MDRVWSLAHVLLGGSRKKRMIWRRILALDLYHTKYIVLHLISQRQVKIWMIELMGYPRCAFLPTP